MSWCKRNTYLTFEAVEDNTDVAIFHTVALELSGTFQIQLNDNDWKDVDFNDIEGGQNCSVVGCADQNVMTMQTGDKLRFRGFTEWSQHFIARYASFQVVSGAVDIYGSIAKSFSDDLCKDTTLSSKFSRMFMCNSYNKNTTGIRSVANLNLNGVNVTQRCFSHMFNGQCAMHDMPMLPASFVDVYGYSSMFVHCSSITSDAYLPAMDFSYNSYMNMFSECSSLTAIHFPKAFQDDETILKKAGSDAPWFGATTATIYYDL